MRTLATSGIIANIEKNGVITEKGINLLKRRANAGRYGFHNYVACYEFGGMEYYVCGGIQIVG